MKPKNSRIGYCSRRWRQLFLLLFVSSMSGFVCAGEVVYEFRDEQGNVVISDVKPEGVDDVRTISLPKKAAPDGAGLSQHKIRASQIRLENKIENRRLAKQRIALARQAVADAEQALVEGRTAEPGERQATVSGGSRLMPAYYARIEKLEAQVVSAKEDLRSAQTEFSRLPK